MIGFRVAFAPIHRANVSRDGPRKVEACFGALFRPRAMSGLSSGCVPTRTFANAAEVFDLRARIQQRVGSTGVNHADSGDI